MDQILRDFFNSRNLDNFLSSGAIIVSRPDGIPLISYEVGDKGWEENSLSALAAASWQAAESIVKVFGSMSSDDYRFSFDTTSSGFYILKLNTSDDLIISYIYNDQENPGKAKSLFRGLKDSLESYLLENKEATSNDTFLFDEISDDEVDELFMGVVG